MGPGWRVLVPALALLPSVLPVPGSSSQEGDLRGSRPADRCGRDPLASGRTWTSRAKGASDGQERSPREAPVRPTSFWSSSGPGPRRRPPRAAGEASGASCELLQFQCSCPAGPCSLEVETPFCAAGPLCSAEDTASELLPGTDVAPATVTMGAPITAAASTHTSTPLSRPAILSSSAPGLAPGPHCPHSLAAPQPGRQRLCPLTQSLPAQGPGDLVPPVSHRYPGADTRAPLSLGFQVQMAAKGALCLRMDFGDSSSVQVRIRCVSEEAAVTAHHQYGKEGVYVLRAALHNEWRGTERELGPYYVHVGRAAASVFVNSSSVHDGEVLAFGSPADRQGTVLTHRFPPISCYNVSFTSQTHVGDSQAWAGVTVRYQLQPVSVYTNGTVFATDTDIAFVAVTKETSALEFVWFFGGDPPVRTTSRSIKRRLGVAQWYRVVVQASNGMSSMTSEPHHVWVQRRVVPSRLVAASSALVNATVTFQCRLTFGSDVTYLWDFGDGAAGLGSSSASHIYRREGEFTVEALAFNNISSASLKTHLFIVREPCQPPPVKNSGPGKVQVWRSQPVTLAVTFEAAILCDISRGLSYTWSVRDSAGLRVPLPPAVSTRRRTITVSSYFLEPGNYTVLAKVQVESSIVYTNHCVGVEVRARAPVSVISEGTHLFVPRTPSSTVVLRGSLSYDPDRPGAALRYYWTCTPASSPGAPCFSGPSPRSLDAGAPTLSFAALSLSGSYDQFLVTLTVSSNGRNSSEAQVFLSTQPDASLRLARISWVRFRDVSVNWNEELSLHAECDACGSAAGRSYSWDLFLVNATEKRRSEVPFCRTVGQLGSSSLGAALGSSQSAALSPGPSGTHPRVMPTPSSRDPQTPGRPDRPAAASASVGPTAALHRAPAAGDTAGPAPSPAGGSPAPEAPDFEAYYSDIQEAMPPAGRQPGANTRLPESGPNAGADGSHGDGDNLLGPFFPAAGARPTLLVDWPKALVGRAVFHGYTASGITGQTVTIKPYSLSPGETYVLQASVASNHSFLGKAQLYLTTNPAPRGVACQVQPHHGLEAHTTFSVFCTSGAQDFRYEFSYQTGSTPKHTLYHGTDAQYYFALPAGEPSDGYQVLVSTEITDGRGSQVPPCAVAVTVLPRFHGNRCPGEDVYNSSLKHLSTLQLMGSYTEMRNYISVITRVLHRWAKEDGSPSCGQWSRIQDALISSVCRLAFHDQEEMMDSVLMLRDLTGFHNQLSLASAAVILKRVRMLLAPSPLSAGFVADEGRARELVLLVSGVLEVAAREASRKAAHLHTEGIQAMSDLLLGCLSSGAERQLHVRAGQTEFSAQLHAAPQSVQQSLGPVQVLLPADLAGARPPGPQMQSLCYISQLVLSKKDPYPGARASAQVGVVVTLSLYRCSSPRPIRRQRLTTPVTVDFGEDADPGDRRNQTAFVLLRDRVNFHQFVGRPESPQDSLQIRIDFFRPVSRAFPVMVLVRFSEKPAPSHFLVKQTFSWDEHVIHISIPASLQDSTLGYLSLFDADYDRTPRNKYLAEAVSYSVRFQWVRCLFWDMGEWKSASFPPQPGTSPEKVSCSYDRLSAFSVVRTNLNTSFETCDVSKLQRQPENLLPSIIIMVFTILYAPLVTKSRRVDRREKKKTGYIFLEENTPPGHQLYAIVVDTGFRAPARFTAKVYIVLCGENGHSEPKQLYHPEKPLFERNSRHTFVLSVPAPLGPLRKVRLWHDNRGPSPAWYVSHVMVKELLTRRGHSWFFPAECWLAAGRRDGRVERELVCLRQGPGFWTLLYSKFTESLEDFHVWASTHSRPSGRGPLHTPRLSVTFTLLCAHACVAALVTAAGHEQLPVGVGPTGIPLGSLRTGFLCALLVSPGAQLLLLLFRLSEVPAGVRVALSRAERWGRPQSPLAVCSESAQASGDGADRLPPQLEACGAGLGQQASREKSDHCALRMPGDISAPSGGFEGLASSWCPKAPPPWVGSAAWAVCGMVSVACGLGTGFLGYRFGLTQCAQWLCLLTLSVVCCVFVTQPLMIGLAALGFAWKRKGDKHFFTVSLHEATKDLDAELERRCRTGAPGGAGGPEKALAARQQARRLRWARPPPPAQLRVTRERMRREVRTQAALRDIALCTLMLLLHLFVTHGKFSQHECSLNQAIRDTFTRRRSCHQVALRARRRNGDGPSGPVARAAAPTRRSWGGAWRRVAVCLSVLALRSAGTSFGGLGGVDAWWGWSLTTLLDGLYQHGPSSAGPSGAQPGALAGKCYLMGTVVIKQQKGPPGGPHEPRPLSVLVDDPHPTCCSKVRGPETPSVTDPEMRRVAPSGPGGCREDCELSLGSTRAAAHAALTGLRARRWVDGSSRAVSVHFTLYNPPTRLFSRVTLSAEMLPAGRLALSSLVESVVVFHSDSAPRYHLTLPERLPCPHHAAGGLLGVGTARRPHWWGGAGRTWHALQRPPGHWATLTLQARLVWMPTPVGFLGVLEREELRPAHRLPRARLSELQGQESRPVLGAGQELHPQHNSSALPLSCWFISPLQLAFLVLAMTHLCVQLYRMAEEGVRRYWRKPGNWLELSIAGTGLACCAASGHLLSLAGEVTDQFHKGLFHEFVDLSHMAAWSQVRWVLRATQTGRAQCCCPKGRFQTTGSALSTWTRATWTATGLVSSGHAAGWGASVCVEQNRSRTRWLQGTLSFLLTLKCLHLLGLGNMMASCSLVPRPSLSGVFAPGVRSLSLPRFLPDKPAGAASVSCTLWGSAVPDVSGSVGSRGRGERAHCALSRALAQLSPADGLAGVLVLAAHAHLRSPLLLTLAPPSGIFAAAFHCLLCHLPGRSRRAVFLGRSEPDRRAAAWCYVALLTALNALCFGTLRGSLMTFARKRKPFQSRSLVTLRDVTAYLWGQARTLLGLQRPKPEEAELAENHSYYLEEFAGLLDELLLKINGLSDNPELRLPEPQPGGAAEAGAEECSLVGASADQAPGQPRE
ncbi:polycystin-1-like protein 1 [Hipposideros larvatus]